jgi:hypothetical protein
MKVENERHQLTQSELNVLAQDGERWQRMGAGAHLDDWLAFTPGLMLRRTMAMRIAHTNEPRGKGYVVAFKALMEHDGLGAMDKDSVTALLWLDDDPERITALREIRATMTMGERSRLNSPVTAYQRVKKWLAVKAGGEAQAAKTKSSPFARQAEQIMEQQREIELLKERLAHAEQRDGSLFDLKRDSVVSIVDTIVRTITPGRAQSIHLELGKWLKKQKAPSG